MQLARCYRLHELHGLHTITQGIIRRCLENHFNPIIFGISNFYAVFILKGPCRDRILDRNSQWNFRDHYTRMVDFHY